ncbi:MAG: hypothetical protein CFK49_04095 [Armatimonadetes bacterium JP3_11]|jgi:hypothetical protein|nr:MAG: hypothetical protein CFK49_04095 [Armatimonadetes bacterium JP3_11]
MTQKLAVWRRIWILAYFAALQMFLGVVAYAQEATVSLPERIVFVALEKESPLINLIHEPATTIKKIAVEQGYNIYEHDEVTFIIPPDKKINKNLFMMNQLLILLPQSIYEKGSFQLSELTQEAKDSFYSLFKDAATKIDDERAIIISINIYASLPSEGNQNAEKIWVASLREGFLSSVKYAQVEPLDNETPAPSTTRDSDTTTTLSMRALSNLDIRKEYTVSFHFNFKPSLDSALNLINQSLFIINERNKRLEQQYRQLVQKVIELYLSRHQLQLGRVPLHAMPQPILRSIEEYLQQKEKFPGMISDQIELQAQLYIHVPLRLSVGTVYFGIPLGGQ